MEEQQTQKQNDFEKTNIQNSKLSKKEMLKAWLKLGRQLIICIIVDIAVMLLNFVKNVWLALFFGKFGKRTLKKQYRKPWIWFWRIFAVWVVWRFVIIPALDKWDGVVQCLNYVIWGGKYE